MFARLHYFCVLNTADKVRKRCSWGLNKMSETDIGVFSESENNLNSYWAAQCGAFADGSSGMGHPVTSVSDGIANYG